MISVTLLAASLFSYQDVTAAYDNFSACIRTELDRATSVASSKADFARYLATACKVEEEVARTAMIKSMNHDPRAEDFHRMAVDSERAVTVDLYPGD